MNSLEQRLNPFSEFNLDQKIDAGLDDSLNNIVELLLKASEAYEFRDVVVANLGTTETKDPLNSIITTSLRMDFFYRFNEALGSDHCPIFDKAKYSICPFGWGSIDVVELTKPQTESNVDAQVVMTALLEEYEIGGGYAIPVRGTNGQACLVVFCGPHDCTGIKFPELFQSTVELMEYVLMQTHLTELAKNHLTRRELECLAWVSEGKTSGELAKIIGLSEHTINHYLLSVTRKLDTVNRTQAVAKALRMGMIR